jgi:hypothetical protein
MVVMWPCFFFFFDFHLFSFVANHMSESKYVCGNLFCVLVFCLVEVLSSSAKSYPKVIIEVLLML